MCCCCCCFCFCRSFGSDEAGSARSFSKENNIKKRARPSMTTNRTLARLSCVPPCIMEAKGEEFGLNFVPASVGKFSLRRQEAASSIGVNLRSPYVSSGTRPTLLRKGPGTSPPNLLLAPGCTPGGAHPRTSKGATNLDHLLSGSGNGDEKILKDSPGANF